jgi:hypothetical protein
MVGIPVELRDNSTGVVLNRTLVGALSPNAHAKVSCGWTVPRNATPGPRAFALLVDPEGIAHPSGYPGHQERIRENNLAPVAVTVQKLAGVLQIPWKESKVVAGTQFVVGGKVVSDGPEVPLDNVTVRLTFTGGGPPAYAATLADGSFAFRVRAPEAAGKQTFTVSMENLEGSAVTLSLTVTEAAVSSAALLGAGIAVVAIALALVGFFLFARVRSQALAQCDRCGTMVRFEADRCPKCNTEFDMEKVRCSACFAWIPASARECPNCEAKFGRGRKGVYDESARLRKKYDEYVEIHRTEFKRRSKTTYSEAGFRSWWRQQESFRTRKQFIEAEGRTRPPRPSGRPAVPARAIPAAEAKKTDGAPTAQSAEADAAPPGTAVPPPGAPPAGPATRDDEGGVLKRAKELLAGAPNLPRVKRRELPPRRCLECFAMNSLDAEMCWSCSTPLEPLLRCEKCGEWAPPEVDFCPRCGNSISIG